MPSILTTAVRLIFLKPKLDHTTLLLKILQRLLMALPIRAEDLLMAHDIYQDLGDFNQDSHSATPIHPDLVLLTSSLGCPPHTHTKAISLSSFLGVEVLPPHLWMPIPRVLCLPAVSAQVSPSQRSSPWKAVEHPPLRLSVPRASMTLSHMRLCFFVVFIIYCPPCPTRIRTSPGRELWFVH